MIAFTVPGKPVPQGSMRAFTRKGGGVGMTPGNEKEVGEFRSRVALAAQAAGARPVCGPVRVKLFFWLPRPKGHFGTGRNEGVLKASAPRYPVVKPDIDKLVRACLDALTAVAFDDDNQVVHLEVLKEYARVPCTDIAIEPLDVAAQAAGKEAS